MEDLDQILSGETPVEEAVQEEPVEEVEQPQEEAPAEEVSAEPEAPDEGQKEHQAAESPMVPLTALQEVRAELKALKEAREAPKPQPVPDMFEDPQGFQQHIAQTIDHKVFNERLNFSEASAVKENGKETVEQARENFMQAAQANPALAQALRQQADPYGFVMEWHKQQTFIREVGNDPEAYKAKLRDELRKEIQAELVAENIQATAQTKTPSLAGKPNLGPRQAQPVPDFVSIDDILGV